MAPFTHRTTPRFALPSTWQHPHTVSGGDTHTGQPSRWGWRGPSLGRSSGTSVLLPPPGPVWGPPRSCGQGEVGVRTAAWAPASPGRLSPQYHEAPGSVREWSGRASLAPGSAHAPGAVLTPAARARALGATCSPLLLSRVPGNGFSPTSWRWKTPLTSSSRGPRRWTSSGKAWSGGGVPGVSRS